MVFAAEKEEKAIEGFHPSATKINSRQELVSRIRNALHPENAPNSWLGLIVEDLLDRRR